MSRDPFKVDGPTCISFSGGRTSAYMLWRVLQSHGGKLPDEAMVCFANTGREDEATLRFVRDCSEHWGVPITWVEYRSDEAGFAAVAFDSASRDGEPFAAMIAKEQFLPSPVQRICTSRLKVRVMHKMLRARGWTEWDQFIGIRADEPRRVAKIRARPNGETSAETMHMPLADAGVSVGDVGAFWAAQPFGLELATFNGRTLAGNCDLCFLKPVAQVQSLIAERPSRAIWWVRMEALAKDSFGERRSPYAYHFAKDRPSYAAMLHAAQTQQDFIGHADEEAIPCFCGD
jgi:3'-phosphoadenosine 5'-phosphosulfate sulfotransferase (PAPS reductase)/FAD synthetase